MKRLFLTILLLAATLGIVAKERTTEIKVATYNVWDNRHRAIKVRKSEKVPETRLWENSRDIVAQMIIDGDWDIFGVQEGGDLIRKELPNLIKQKGGKYKWWFQRQNPAIPENEDRKIANGIVWRSDRFKVSNKQVFWLSPTPDTPSKAWEEKVNHLRFVMSATVKDKKTGIEFIFMVTHCPLMQSTREKSAHLIIEREKMMNPENKTVIFVGDMNDQPHMPYSQIIRTHFTDTRDIAEAKSEVAGTKNGAELSTTVPKKTIDYIYIRGNNPKYKVLEHNVRIDKYQVGEDLLFPSDHCPVEAVIVLTK